MNRKDFLKRLLRYLLFALLGLIAVITGSRTTLASDCSQCPGKGLCSGETDCSKYLKK